MESLFVIETWQWWVFGILLILAEAVVPQAFLIWIGLSAVLTGSVGYFKSDISGITAILLFILTSAIVSSIGARLGYKSSSVFEKNKIKTEKKKKRKPAIDKNPSIVKMSSSGKKSPHPKVVKNTASRKKKPNKS